MTWKNTACKPRNGITYTYCDACPKKGDHAACQRWITSTNANVENGEILIAR